MVLPILILFLSVLMFTTSNMVIFYMTIELSILLFVYYFSYSTYVERTYSFSYIVTYILCFSLPLLTLILGLNTINFNCIVIIEWRWIISISFILLFLGKLPVFGIHYWLLKAHSNCSTEGSVILAALILKVGVYGFIYYNYLFNHNLKIIQIVFVIGIIISSINLIYIVDIKTIIAQTRVTHICFLGWFMTTSEGNMDIIIIYCIVHGITTTVLFSLGGDLMNINKSRNIIMLNIKGAAILFWAFILINNSFPISPYFIVEVYILTILISTIRNVLLIILLVIIIINGTVFINWFHSGFKKISRSANVLITSYESTYLISTSIWLVYMY